MRTIPKLLENARGQIIDETRRQIDELGYSETTIRSIAHSCDIGVGTVYNYFTSKDAIILTYVLEDWMVHFERIKKIAAKGCDTETLFSHIHSEFRQYIAEHSYLFSDNDIAAPCAAISATLIPQLRRQITDIIYPILSEDGTNYQKFLAPFLANAMLHWTEMGVPFNTLWSVLKKTL